MSALSPQEIGKRWERDLEANFRTMQKFFGFKWHRFTDSHEAGNAVREQPADYLVTTPKGLALVEAKASTTLSRFRPSLLRPAQKGAIRHYAQMLGVPYFVLFRDDTSQRVDLLNGKDCLEAKPIPLRAFKTTALADALAEAWSLKPLRSTLQMFKQRYGDDE